MNINSPVQVTQVINDSVSAANAAIALLATLSTYDVESSTNGVHDALTAQGAQLPPGFTLTPAKIEDARFALASLKAAFASSMATYQPSLDALRLHLGVLTGTG